MPLLKCDILSYKLLSDVTFLHCHYDRFIIAVVKLSV